MKIAIMSFAYYYVSATLPSLLTTRRPKYLDRNRPTSKLYIANKLDLKSEEDIGDSLEFQYRSYLVNVHTLAKMNETTRTAAKFHTVDLENKG